MMDEGYAGSGRSEHSETYWVTIEEAASEASVSPSTVIAWIAEGSIVSQTASGTDGMVAMVRRSEVIERARRATEENASTPDEPAVTTPGADLAPLLKSLPELIRDLVEAKERAAKAETKLEFVTERLREVRTERDDLLQKLSSAGPAPAAPPSVAPRPPAPEPVRISEEAARASEGLNDILQGLREMNDRISHREPRPLEDLETRRSTPPAATEPEREGAPQTERRAVPDPRPSQADEAEDEDDIWDDAPRAAESPSPAYRPTLTRVEEPEDEDDIWDEGIYPDRRTRAASDGATETRAPEPEVSSSEPVAPVRPEGWNPAPRDPGLKSSKRWWNRRG